MSSRQRRWNGWGFEGETDAVGDATLAWLTARLGRGDALPTISEEEVAIPASRALPQLPGAIAGDRGTRLRHACGQSFPDLVALRTGRIQAFPDGVAFPSSPEEVVSLLRAAGLAGVSLVVRGGGTSVVGGVTVVPGDRPVVVVSLSRLAGLTAVDEVSRLATFRAGTEGPAAEAALSPFRLRLGHEPQSFELSTVGGWLATRSAGHRSSGVGKIEDLVAGVQVATGDGLLTLAPFPASAAGPELRRLLLGSEGRLGVITEATVRVRPLPPVETGRSVLMPGWEAGQAACRVLLQRGSPVEVLRLSDEVESSFAASLLHVAPAISWLGGALLGRGGYRDACLMLIGWAGEGRDVSEAMAVARAVWRSHGGVSLGPGGWRRWRAERFRHPYLREALLAAGFGVDTLETAGCWSSLSGISSAVRAALAEGGKGSATPVTVLCHLSHAYRDGASLYFTFFWPLRRGEILRQWQGFKTAATEALLAAGGTLTHHHGVGSMHAPYLEREVGREGVRLLRAAAAAADPAGILNPGVLFPEEQ